MNRQRAFSVTSWPLASGLLLGLVAVAMVFAPQPWKPNPRRLAPPGWPPALATAASP